MSRRRSVDASVRRSNTGPNWRRTLHSTASNRTAYTSLDEFLHNLPSGDHFGDDPNIQPAGLTRVVFQNVRGVPDRSNHPKQTRLFDWIKKERVGIALFAEMNKHWPSVPRGQKWRDRLRSSFSAGHFSSVAWNTRQRRIGGSKSQPGGCSTSIIGQVAHGAQSSGQDPTGLGRFSWCRIQGKARKRNFWNSADDEDVRSRTQDLIVVSAYRPCGSGKGPTTVWAQHKDYFLSKGRQEDPRAAFITDLEAAIEEWTSWGCEIIIGMDANEDLSKIGPTSIRGRLKEVGLTEAILHRFPDSPPATQIDNTRNEPIDGIFTSAGVKVRAGGYYGFYEQGDSDHRALWVDIDLFATLGGFSPSKSYNTRRLNVKNRSVRRRYVRLAEEGYKRHNIPQRLDKLNSQLFRQGGSITPSQEARYNAIHSDIRTIRSKAELKCRKIKRGGKPWSPQSQVIQDRIQLWRILLDRHSGNRVPSRKLRRLLVTTGLRDSYKWPTTQIETKLSEDLCLNRRLSRSNTFATWRKSFLVTKQREIHKAYAKKKTRYNREREMSIRQMRQREETRRRRRARGKGFSGGLKMIQIERSLPDGTTERVSCSDQLLVEEGCMQENQERYDQTRFPFPTPPMRPPLYQEFTGPLAEDYVSDLLDGRWEIPPSVRPPTRAFLTQCRSNLPPLPLRVDRNSNTRFWQRNPEMKGSEPHGLHNGHYKAATFSPLLSACDAACRDIPLTTGIAPLAWRNLMNFAIEKKPGDFRVKKMRTIQMMDAEFQANNKLVGKKAMEFAERNSLIPPGQCGSRKKHQAIDLALSKTLVWDQLILRRQPAGWVLNDAKSCFDRVVHWVAQVALRRFGIPWATVDMMFRTLQVSTHRVRTGFGDSSRVFSPPSEYPFQGCGQGNGAGPTIWVAISSILIDTMEAAGHGFDFLSALDLSLRVAECFCFVDDTDLVEGAVNPEVMGDHLFVQIQKALSLWSECVRSTGGAINPEKSFWWMIDFNWHASSGSWRFRSNEDLTGSLWIRDLANRPAILTRLRPDQTEKTLGVMMSPKFNEKDQREALTKKASDWASTVKNGSLLPYDVFPLIRTTIMKSLEYPMALTHLSKVQWEKIMSPILRIALPKARVCRNFPREVVYGPIKYQGLGIPHPSGLQLTHHLDMLLRHPVNHTSTSRFLDACYQSHQLETGTSYGLLQQDYSNTAILTSETWLKRVWKELDPLSIHVETNGPALQFRCDGDQLLMDVFIAAEVDQVTLKWLNWCRLFLHVTTISDIASADGKHINEDSWNGKRTSFSRSRYDWPRTVRPTEHWWRVWREVLSATLLSDETSLALTTPLGQWTDDIFDWNWLYSPSRNRLYCRQGHGWLLCPRIQTRNQARRPTFIYKVFRRFERNPLPPDVQRATVAQFQPTMAVHGYPPPRIRSFLRLTGVGLAAPQMSRIVPSIFEQWEQCQQECDGNFGWVPESIKISGSEEALLEALQLGLIRIISDGSYKDGVGSAATQITTKDRAHTIWIRCQTPGQQKDQSAYRSELIGILAGVQVATWLRKQLGTGYLSTLRPIVTLACDGKAALDISFDTWTLKPTSKQFDLISAIREAIRDSFISWHTLHVKGHQDDLLDKSKLSWWALRNIECDARAKRYRCRLVRQGRQTAANPRFFTEPSALFIESVKQSRLCPDGIMELITLPPLLSYWERRGRLNSLSRREINWPRVKKMMKTLPSGLQRWTCKHATGMCGVGKWKFRWKFSKVNQCPRCRAPEDHLHIPRCPSESATKEWEDRVYSFRTWMEAHSTAPEIQVALLRFLACVRGNAASHRQVDHYIFSQHPALLRKAVVSQKVIGVQCMLEGLLSRHWASLQTLHFQSLGSRKSGEVWYSKIAAQLIWIGFHMWQHRNGVQHSADNLQLRNRQQDANYAIREQFVLGVTDLPTNVHAMLRRPRLEVLRLPLDEREAWIRILRESRRHVRQTVERQRRIMRAYFLPPPRLRVRRRFFLRPPPQPPPTLVQPPLFRFWRF